MTNSAEKEVLPTAVSKLLVVFGCHLIVGQQMRDMRHHPGPSINYLPRVISCVVDRLNPDGINLIVHLLMVRERLASRLCV